MCVYVSCVSSRSQIILPWEVEQQDCSVGTSSKGHRYQAIQQIEHTIEDTWVRHLQSSPWHLHTHSQSIIFMRKFIEKILLKNKQQKWNNNSVLTNLSKYYRAALGSKEFFFLDHINYQSSKFLHLILLSGKRKTRKQTRHTGVLWMSKKNIIYESYILP